MPIFTLKNWCTFLDFSWKRCVVRTLILMTALFIAESFPDFTFILNLLGATTTAIASYIAPPLLYIKLKSSGDNNISTE